MPDLSTNIAAGQTGHAGLHNDERTEINSIRSRLATVEATPGGTGGSLSHKGEWNSGITYAAGDVVQHRRQTYLARGASTGSSPAAGATSIVGGQTATSGASLQVAGKISASIKVDRLVVVTGIEVGFQAAPNFRRIGIAEYFTSGPPTTVLAEGFVDVNTGAYPRYARVNFSSPALLAPGEYSLFVDGFDLYNIQFAHDGTPPVFASPVVAPDDKRWSIGNNTWGSAAGGNLYLRYRLVESTNQWVPLTAPPAATRTEPRMWDETRIEPLPIHYFSGGTVPLDNGWSIFQFFTPQETQYVSGIDYFVATAGAGATASRVALYEYNATSGAWERRARGNASTLFTTANTRMSAGLDATVVCHAGRRYAFAFLSVGATTVPTLQGKALGTGVGAAMRRFGTSFATGQMTGQTDLPTSITDGNISSNYDNAILCLGTNSSGY